MTQVPWLRADAEAAGDVRHGDVGDGHVEHGDEVGAGQDDGDQPQHARPSGARRRSALSRMRSSQSPDDFLSQLCWTACRSWRHRQADLQRMRCKFGRVERDAHRHALHHLDPVAGGVLRGNRRERASPCRRRGPRRRRGRSSAAVEIRSHFDRLADAHAARAGTSLKLASTCTSDQRHDGQHRRAGLDLLADLHRPRGDHAVDRRADDGALEVHLRLVARARAPAPLPDWCPRWRRRSAPRWRCASRWRRCSSRAPAPRACAPEIGLGGFDRRCAPWSTRRRRRSPNSRSASRRCRSTCARSRSASAEATCAAPLFVRCAGGDLRREARVVGDVAAHAAHARGRARPRPAPARDGRRCRRARPARRPACT